MTSSSSEALATVERLRELALEQALLALRQAQHEVASRAAAREHCERALHSLLQSAPPHPSTFEDISTMKQAELFRMRHKDRVTACQSELETAIAQHNDAEIRLTHCQEQVRQARAELEVVRRKQAEQARAVTREQLRRSDEAVDELVDSHRRRETVRKPD